MRARVIYICIVLCTLLAATGCNGRLGMHVMPYYEFRHVDADDWRNTDTLRFKPDTALLAADNELSISVRLGQHFNYRDLWLVCERRSNLMQHPRRDTLHLILANPRGRWTTAGVVLHETEQAVGQIHFDKKESPEFLVYHIMREQGIQGIFDIGLHLEPMH